MVSFSAFLVLSPQSAAPQAPLPQSGGFPTVRVEVPGANGALSVLVPKTASETASSGFRVWTGKEESGADLLTFLMNVAPPGAAPRGEERLRASILRDQARFEGQGGETTTIRRGDAEVRLTFRARTTGVEYLESSFTPVVYARHIVATGKYVADAKRLLLSHAVYGGALPTTGWTTLFAGERVAVPLQVRSSILAMDAAKDGVAGTARSTLYADGTQSRWSLTVRPDLGDRSIVDVAKMTMPLASMFGPASTLDGSDVVEWKGHRLLRQRGTTAQGREWVGLTSREVGELWTQLVSREKGAPWPRELPVRVDLLGLPVMASAWPVSGGASGPVVAQKPQTPIPSRPNLPTSTAGETKVERTEERSSRARFSYTVMGSPKSVGNVTTLHDDGPDTTRLYVGSVADQEAKRWATFDVFVPKWILASPDPFIDISRKVDGDNWWVQLRTLGKDKAGRDAILRTEVVGTEQGGTTFVLAMTREERLVGPSKALREVVLSCKGADGRPLFATYPEGEPKTAHAARGEEYIVPPNPPARFAATHLGEDRVLLAGSEFPDGAFSMYSYTLRAERREGQDLAVGASLWPGQKGVSTPIDLRVEGKPVSATRIEYRDSGGATILLTTIYSGKGVYLHVRQRAGMPETWRTTFGIDG